jgi:hypothetical protein
MRVSQWVPNDATQIKIIQFLQCWGLQCLQEPIEIEVRWLKGRLDL